ncbi:hypothetical protein EIK56_27320 [Sphingomonas sp. C8-2]|nr:hypothetical protein EIK56_27320 [Sphingomonas sp. C8-2]
MARYGDGLKTATTIFEAAAMHQRIKVLCAECRHHAIFDPHGLWWLFERRGWTGQFAMARHHFWCRPCSRFQGTKVKQAMITLTSDRATIILERPSERTWKRAIDRYRG